MGRPARRDLVTAVVLVAVGAFIIWKSQAAADVAFVDAGGVTPGTLPTIYAAILVALSGLMGWQALRGRAVGKEAVFRLPRRVWGRILGTLALLIAYALLLPVVPFAALTFVFLAGLFLLYGHRRPVTVLATAVLGTAALELVFIHLLGLPI